MLMYVFELACFGGGVLLESRKEKHLKEQGIVQQQAKTTISQRNLKIKPTSKRPQGTTKRKFILERHPNR